MEFCDRTGTPHSILLGRVQQPREPYYLPEDRAKLHALWAWRAEHCPSCQQRRADWLGPNGEEIPDPPFEIATTVCPSCGDLEQWEEENPKSERRAGEKPYFRRTE